MSRRPTNNLRRTSCSPTKFLLQPRERTKIKKLSIRKLEQFHHLAEVVRIRAKNLEIFNRELANAGYTQSIYWPSLTRQAANKPKINEILVKYEKNCIKAILKIAGVRKKVHKAALLNMVDNLDIHYTLLEEPYPMREIIRKLSSEKDVPISERDRKKIICAISDWLTAKQFLDNAHIYEYPSASYSTRYTRRAKGT